MKFLARLRPFLTISNTIAALLLVGSVAAFLWLRSNPEINVFTREGLETLVKALGWRGPLFYTIIIALAVVISQIPGVPLAIAAGALWGPVPAGIYSVIGAFIGGMVAYFLARTLGRSAMKALTGKVVIFSSERGERYLGLIIFITRLLPVLSFDIISYAAGLSGLSAPIYALATLLGVIPSTFLLTFLGSVLTVSLPVALSLSAVAAVTLVALPILIQRYNWFNLRGSIKLE